MVLGPLSVPENMSQLGGCHQSTSMCDGYKTVIHDCIYVIPSRGLDALDAEKDMISGVLRGEFSIPILKRIVYPPGD